MTENIKAIENHHESIHEFVRVTKSYKLALLFKDSEKYLSTYSYLSFYFKCVCDNLRDFESELRLTKDDNRIGTKTYLKAKILQPIAEYRKWYNINQEELAKLKPNSVCDKVIDIFERTEKEVLIYFPELGEDVLEHQKTKKQSRTKKVIAETFENMDKKGWQYAFSTEQDYILFTDLLTDFFEYKRYLIPETAIQLKRTCKTKLAKALGEIHAELSENPLNSDTEYIKIVRVLNHFKEGSDFDLVKAMQR